MTAKTEFERAIERKTGESVESIRKMSIDDRRKMNEKKFHHVMEFVSMFDFIGRGNILRKNAISHGEVEKELEEAIRL
jgi:hypothetical protein